MSEWQGSEVGLVPADWQIQPLEHFIQENRGICYGVVQPGFHDEDGVPIIRVNNLRDGSIVSDDVLKVSPEIEAKYSRSRLQGNELLISLVGNVGEIVIVDDKYKGWNVARAVGVVPVDRSIDRDWLKYWLQSSQIKHHIKTHCNTTVQATLNLKDVAALPILEPSLAEQKEIAAVLSCLDRKIENLRRQNETLEAIAQTLFKHWFVDFEFPNADGKPYKSSGGEMVPSAIGEIPAGWRVGKIGDFGKVITGKTPSTKQDEYWGGNLPFVTPTDFKNYGKFVLSSERKLSSAARSQFGRLIIPENSVVVTCIGSDMGKVARTATPCVTNQQLNSLIFNQIKNGIEYVYQFLINQYKKLRLMALGGSTMPIINKTDFSSIEILIPEGTVLDQFNQVVESTNLKIINNSQQIQTLTKTRDVLLPKLMSGKLRITDEGGSL